MKWQLFLFAFLGSLGVARADEPRALLEMVGPCSVPWTIARPDGYAPIGVMQDHAHAAGTVMAGFRYRIVDFQGLGHGARYTSELRTLERFPIAPTSMRRVMYDLSLMWAPVDFVTVMAMTTFADFQMQNRTSSLGTFDTTAAGIADTRLTTIWRILRLSRQQLLLNLGMSFPTGSTDEVDRTPLGPGTRLPYPMQLGSGSWEILPGITYVGQTFDYSWGGQALASFRLGKNDQDWRRGHAVTTTLWFAYRFVEWMSASARVAYDYSGDVDGADPALSRSSSPAADPNLQSMHRLAVLFGANLYAPKGTFRSLRMAIEGGFVPFQSLDGPQLKTADRKSVV